MSCEQVTQLDLCVVQGQDGDGVRIPVQDAVGQAIDVSTWTARAHIRDRPSGALADTLTCACGPTGVTVTWTGAQTLTWTRETYRYDVELTSPTSQRHRLVEGRITVDPAVTHD